MNIQLKNGLPYVLAKLEYRGQHLEFANVLLNTGSASTIFAIDKLSSIGIQYEPHDMVQRIRGVGGSEFVFSKQIDTLAIGTLTLSPFIIELGAMYYGFEIDGIIGMNFLIRLGASIDFSTMQLLIR